MPSILDYLNTISDARYGRDVRQAIVDAISACYQDGRAGVSDLEARRLIESAIGVNESQQADIDTLYAQIAEIQDGSGESSQESTTITLDTVIYDGGFVDSVTVNNNATKTYDVTFTQTFTEVPEVFACVAVQNSAAASYSKVTVGIVKAQTTTTGFRFFIANTSGATRSTTVVWAAFQPTTKEIDLDITIPSGDGMSEADVLAITNPIQSSLNGIKTGYDGTVYSTPGEAVRQQISDLHVLIGDEPGMIIPADVVKYKDGSVADALDVFTDNVDESVQNWLDQHPEATTTVVDGSITEAKLADALKLKTVNGYVTPQMYGAKGDGITDDTSAFQELSGKTAYIPEGTYIVSHVEYGRKTFLFGAGMGRTIIQQKTNATGDLFDFADADCSGMVNISLYGNKSETSSDIYRALLKIRTTRDQVVNYSHYCNFEHIVIRNAPASGFVLLGRSSSDPNHPLSNYNWVHHFNDIRVEECNLWCMIDETSDNLFSNLYLNEGNLGNLRCYGASSNMYANIKADQPYGGGSGGTLDSFDNGALILLRSCDNIRFVNADIQSAYYVGVKIYNCAGIHFDGDINNCGLGANGLGIGLWLKASNSCTFNLEMHDFGAQPQHNVKIESDCRSVSVVANQRYKTTNINNAPATCFIIDPANSASLYNAKISSAQRMINMFADPLCDSLAGWSTTNGETITVDTNSKVVGKNSFKIVGDTTKTINLYQNFSGLKPGDCYMSLAVVNIESLPTNSASIPIYTNMATGGVDSTIYTSHKNAPKELGKHLVAQVGRISNGGDLSARFYVNKNDGVYYVGNFMLFNLSDIGLEYPTPAATYELVYTKLQDAMDTVFNSISVEWDYTQMMGMFKFILNQISVLQPQYFDLADLRSGYIRDDGTIGGASQHVIAGFNGSRLTQTGTGKTYKITVADGWTVKVGKYGSYNVGSFDGLVDISSNTITLESGKYYVFDIAKSTPSAITVADLPYNVVVLEHTTYVLTNG